jgi:hypothetical protein
MSALMRRSLHASRQRREKVVVTMTAVIEQDNEDEHVVFDRIVREFALPALRSASAGPERPAQLQHELDEILARIGRQPVTPAAKRRTAHDSCCRLQGTPTALCGSSAVTS